MIIRAICTSNKSQIGGMIFHNGYVCLNKIYDITINELYEQGYAMKYIYKFKSEHGYDTTYNQNDFDKFFTELNSYRENKIDSLLGDLL